jgi:diketogulonate reductase-like aldo/keto reductase
MTTTQAKTPTLKLDYDTQIPILGFGTWQLEGRDCQEAVETALEIGYRHLDTAEMYGNHQEVARAIKNSGIKREDLFITSKVWFTNLEPENLKLALDNTLEELQTDYLDLWLIHWPNREIPLRVTLPAMEGLRKSGRTRTIGVSNFTRNHLKDALKTGVKISNNQVEYHPSLNQEELREFCQENDITVTAYSPIAQGDDFDLPEVAKIAEKYQRSEAQVILSWLLQKGLVAIPRSHTKKHILDNFKCLEFTLSEEEVDTLDNLNTDHRLVSPEFNDFDY